MAHGKLGRLDKGKKKKKAKTQLIKGDDNKIKKNLKL